MNEFTYQVFGIMYDGECKGWQPIPDTQDWGGCSSAIYFAQSVAKQNLFGWYTWSDVCVKKTNKLTGEVQTYVIKSKGVIQNA